MNTSSLGLWASTVPKMVLNALTTWALAGAALATCCAMEVPSGVASAVAAGLNGLEMSTMTLPASASPYWLTTGAALAYGTARMMMSPAGAAPVVPAVAPPPSAPANSAALAASRPMTSTALPPATARVPRMQAMCPVPMMLMLLTAVLSSLLLVFHLCRSGRPPAGRDLARERRPRPGLSGVRRALAGLLPDAYGGGGPLDEVGYR